MPHSKPHDLGWYQTHQTATCGRHKAQQGWVQNHENKEVSLRRQPGTHRKSETNRNTGRCGRQHKVRTGVSNVNRRPFVVFPSQRQNETYLEGTCCTIKKNKELGADLKKFEEMGLRREPLPLQARKETCIDAHTAQMQRTKTWVQEKKIKRCVVFENRAQLQCRK